MAGHNFKDVGRKIGVTSQIRQDYEDAKIYQTAIHLKILADLQN